MTAFRWIKITNWRQVPIGATIAKFTAVETPFDGWFREGRHITLEAVMIMNRERTNFKMRIFDESRYNPRVYPNGYPFEHYCYHGEDYRYLGNFEKYDPDQEPEDDCL